MADTHPFDNPSKYDAECTAARLSSGAEGVVLLVLRGRLGSGFAVQMPEDWVVKVPAMLRDLANMVEDAQKFKPN